MQELQTSLTVWFHTEILSIDGAIQAIIITVTVLVGILLGRRLEKSILSAARNRSLNVRISGFIDHLAALTVPLLVLALVWIAVEVGEQTDLIGSYLTKLAASLAGAWVIIRFASGYIGNKLIARIATWIAWILVTLVAVGLYDDTIALLDSAAMTFGEVRISLLTIAKGGLVFGILFWISMALSHVLERQIKLSDNLSPSAQVLIVKILKIALIALAVLFTISSLGIDLRALAFFGGALGIGIGFGLQKVVSNLVSGFLLLLDKSIKPNDVIAVGNTYGWVSSLGARYTAVRTRDGVEYLIPNEELITQRVENWSHSDTVIRLRIPVGVSYDTDLDLAMELCRRAANMVERVCTDPEPRCLLRNFGDSSVDLEIRLWINDPAGGRANVTSQVMLNVWNLFKEHSIEIPFPQRDLHLKSSDVLIAGHNAPANS